MAICKRMFQLAADSGVCFPKSQGLYWNRQISQLVESNGKPSFLVDKLKLLRALEAQGVPSKLAEAITAAITKVVNGSLENVFHSFVSKAEMPKREMIQESILLKLKSEMQRLEREMIQESNLLKLKSEMQSLEERYFSLLQWGIEKHQSDIEKMHGELSYEIDKATAKQRLDLNREKQGIRDELANQKAEATNLINKLDKEIYALKAQVEATKYDVIKCSIGIFVSISAVVAVLRILM